MDAREAPQQAGEILELGVLVVDGENRQPVRAHAEETSSEAGISPRRLGTVMTAVVPSPRSDSILSAYRSPNVARSLPSTLDTPMPPPAPASTAPRRSGSIPMPSSDTRSSTSPPPIWAQIVTRPVPARRSPPGR